jgi:hypothetical protein
MRKIGFFLQVSFFLALVLFLVRCSKTDDTTEEKALEAKIVLSSLTGSPGDTITINGESSITPATGTTFTFTINNGVEGTDYTVFYENEKKIQIRTIRAVSFSVTLRIENNGKFNVCQAVNVTISGAKKISNNITSATTLINISDNGADYVIDKVIEVTANLTLNDGVSIEFAASGGLLVKNSAIINFSTGNFLNYISVSSAEGWKGIYLLSGRLNIQQGSVNVINAGYGTWDNGESGAIIVDSTSQINLNDPSGSAIYFDKSGSFNVNVLMESGIVNPSRIISNDEKGLRCFPQQLVGAGNILATVFLNSGSANFNYSATGKELILLGDVTFQNVSTFYFTKVQVSQGKSIVFTGSNDAMIRDTEFVGKDGAEWKGIYFQPSSQNKLTFQNSKITNAGWRENGSSEISAAITSTTGIISLYNCEIENPNGYGVYAYLGINNVNSVTFTNCKNAGMAVNYRNCVNLADNNIFTLDPGVPGIELINGQNTYFNYSFDFKKLNGSFYSVTDNMNLENPVVFSPGAKFVVNPGVSIYITQNLLANGTATDSIIFEGKNRTNGYWNGIVIDGGAMQMKYLRVSDAGSGYLSRGQGSAIFAMQKANMVFFGHNMMNNNQNYLQNSVFSNSGGYGIFIPSSNNSIDEAYVNANNNSFLNNTAGTVVKQ